jgi:hypothetical protein
MKIDEPRQNGPATKLYTFFAWHEHRRGTWADSCDTSRCEAKPARLEHPGGHDDLGAGKQHYQ